MSKRIIFYDTETTGLKANQDRIIEIAAYDATKETSYVSLINPMTTIPPEASAVHHITDEMVQDAPKFDQVAEEFKSFCEGDVVLVAHNNDNFDIHFLREEYKRLEQELPENWLFLDSLKWARKYRPDLPKHALQFLREVYDLPANNAHRALDDVIMLKEIFFLMTGDLSIDTILDLLSVKPGEEVMPFGKFQGKLLKDVPASYVSWLKKSGAFEKPENHNLKTQFEKVGLLHA